MRPETVATLGVRIAEAVLEVASGQLANVFDTRCEIEGRTRSRNET